jgi:hypothetical protein
MKRRTLLALPIAAGAAALGWLFFRKEITKDAPLTLEEQQRQSIADSMIAHFPYLELDEEGVSEFATDHLKNFGPMPPQQRSQIAMTFLLSTDFFPNGADESLPVRYLGYYSPYLGECGNPLAKFVEG